MVKLGICPICGFDRMIMMDQDFDKYDACPKCGFGHGYTARHRWLRKLRNEVLWERILADQVVFSLTRSADTREKVLELVNAIDPSAVARQRAHRRASTVFIYSDEEVVENAKHLKVMSERSLEAAARLGMMSHVKFTLLQEKQAVASNVKLPA